MPFLGLSLGVEQKGRKQLVETLDLLCDKFAGLFLTVYFLNYALFYIKPI